MRNLVASADHHVLRHSGRDAGKVVAQAADQQRPSSVAIRREAANVVAAALESRVEGRQVRAKQHASMHVQLASTLNGMTGSNRGQWSGAAAPLDVRRGPDR